MLFNDIVWINFGLGVFCIAKTKKDVIYVMKFYYAIKFYLGIQNTDMHRATFIFYTV